LLGTFAPCSSKPHAMPHDPKEHETQAEKIKQEADPEKGHGCKLYAHWWTHPRFLFMAAGAGCLGVLSVVDSILGLWVNNVFNPSVSVSGMMCASLPMGIVISIPFWGLIIPRLEPKPSAQAILALVGILCLTILGIVVLTGVVVNNHLTNPSLVLPAAGLVLLYGFMLGFPYYVPPAVFALDFGHASGGMVATFFDLVSAVLSAGASVAVGYLSVSGWVYVWLMFLGLGIVAWGALAYYHVLNLRWIAAGRPDD